MNPDPINSRNPTQSPAADVCLLLRAHGESRWLSNELGPGLRGSEQRRTVCARQLATALAYLEVLWIEAGARARETESARVQLDALGSYDPSLYEKALRYHAAVRRLRDAIEARVCRLLAIPPDEEIDVAMFDETVRDRPASS